MNNQNQPNSNQQWATAAYKFLVDYVKSNKKFLAEDVRMAAENIIPEPKSKRAWGQIFVTAKKNKLITKIGYACVKNPKAHKTPAALWIAK